MPRRLVGLGQDVAFTLRPLENFEQQSDMVQVSF